MARRRGRIWGLDCIDPLQFRFSKLPLYALSSIIHFYEVAPPALPDQPVVVRRRLGWVTGRRSFDIGYGGLDQVLSSGEDILAAQVMEPVAR